MTCILKIVRGIKKTTHQETTKDILLLTLSQINDNVNDLQPTPLSHPQRSFFGMASAVRIMVGTKAPTTQAVNSVTLDVQASNPILFVKTEVEDAQGKTISVDIKLPKLDGAE